jgi:hypothetical protein
MKQLDTIELTANGGGSFTGPDAVNVYRLATLVSGLQLEITCPGMRISRHFSALQAAKRITGLKTNNRAKHLERAKIMLAQAKTQVLYVELEDSFVGECKHALHSNPHAKGIRCPECYVTI